MYSLSLSLYIYIYICVYIYIYIYIYAHKIISHASGQGRASKVCMAGVSGGCTSRLYVLCMCVCMDVTYIHTYTHTYMYTYIVICSTAFSWCYNFGLIVMLCLYTYWHISIFPLCSIERGWGISGGCTSSIHHNRLVHTEYEYKCISLSLSLSIHIHIYIYIYIYTYVHTYVWTYNIIPMCCFLFVYFFV